VTRFTQETVMKSETNFGSMASDNEFKTAQLVTFGKPDLCTWHVCSAVSGCHRPSLKLISIDKQMMKELCWSSTQCVTKRPSPSIRAQNVYYY